MAHPYEDRFPVPPFKEQEISPPGLEEKMDPKPVYKPYPFVSGKLRGKTALISGGDSGIGRAVVHLFAQEGANVAIIFLPEEMKDAERLAEEIRELGRKALLLPGDIKDEEFCRQCVERTSFEFGDIDILVNNAAFQNHLDSISELSTEQWDKCFKTNIYSYFYLTKFALPHMKKGASVINTSSIVGLEGSPGLIDYAATKGAINSFTKALAKQLAPRGIRVNAVAPGPVWTPLNPAEREKEEIKHFGEKVLFDRPAQPIEIAPSFLFLASNTDSSYMTGEILASVGGVAP